MIHNIQEYENNLRKVFVFSASPIHEILTFAGMTKTEAIETER